MPILCEYHCLYEFRDDRVSVSYIMKLIEQQKFKSTTDLVHTNDVQEHVLSIAKNFTEEESCYHTLGQ
jgi:hypothetical protein